MEAGQNAAGHRHEEDGQEVSVCKVVSIGEGADLTGGGVGQAQHGSRPALPNVDQRHLGHKDTDEHANGGEQQDTAEDGVDLADDGIDGEHGGDQIVQEDDAVDDPCGRITGLTAQVEHLGSSDVAGGVDKHSAHQQQHHAHEYIVELIDTLGGVLADHLGHLGAAVTQADHAGEVVVHSTADDVADRNGQERDGPEQDALDRPDDGAGACDVQQVDQAVLPAAHGNEVHAILFRIGGGLPVVRAKDLFAEPSVQGGAADEDHETNNECCHNLILLFTGFVSPKFPDNSGFDCTSITENSSYARQENVSGHKLFINKMPFFDKKLLLGGGDNHHRKQTFFLVKNPTYSPHRTKIRRHDTTHASC